MQGGKGEGKGDEARELQFLVDTCDLFIVSIVSMQ